MEIKETSFFTKSINSLMSDDEYGLLQAALIVNPERGKIIKGSGGIRKVRWSLAGKGKQGGARIIYYWQVAKDQIYMLTAYSKAEKEDLAVKQIKILRAIVEEEIKN
jgi:hypothetical protein